MVLAIEKRRKGLVIIVGDTNTLCCEPQGIPRKGLQIAFVAAIYFNDVICKLASRLRTGKENNINDAHDSVGPNVDSLSAKLKQSNRISTSSPQQVKIFE